MIDEKFVSRSIGRDNDGWLSEINYTIPKACPHCGFANSPTRIIHTIHPYVESNLQVFSWNCTNCHKTYVTGHTRKDISDKNLQFLFIFPNFQARVFPALISEMSPRFVEIFNEASASENLGNLTVAGIGYRLSMELLIKDYAIKELGKDTSKVTDQKLFDAIGEYLPDYDLKTAADVIRIKGNDYAHYFVKYSHVDFDLFKDYMNIFIDLISVKLKLLHPPLARKDR